MKVSPRVFRVTKDVSQYELRIQNSESSVLLFRIRRSEEKVLSFRPKKGYVQPGETKTVIIQILNADFKRTKLLVKMVLCSREAAAEGDFEQAWATGVSQSANGEKKKLIDIIGLQFNPQVDHLPTPRSSSTDYFDNQSGIFSEYSAITSLSNPQYFQQSVVSPLQDLMRGDKQSLRQPISPSIKPALSGIGQSALEALIKTEASALDLDAKTFQAALVLAEQIIQQRLKQEHEAAMQARRLNSPLKVVVDEPKLEEENHDYSVFFGSEDPMSPIGAASRSLRPQQSLDQQTGKEEQHEQATEKTSKAREQKKKQPRPPAAPDVDQPKPEPAKPPVTTADAVVNTSSLNDSDARYLENLLAPPPYMEPQQLLTPGKPTPEETRSARQAESPEEDRIPSQVDNIQWLDHVSRLFLMSTSAASFPESPTSAFHRPSQETGGTFWGLEICGTGLTPTDDNGEQVDPTQFDGIVIEDSLLRDVLDRRVSELRRSSSLGKASATSSPASPSNGPQGARLMELSISQCNIVALRTSLGRLNRLTPDHFQDKRQSNNHNGDFEDWGHTVRLKALAVTHSRLLTLDCATLYENERFRSLTSLDVSHNRIKQLEGPLQLPHLRSLDLSHNHLKSLQGLSQLQALVHLRASHNRFTSALESVRLLGGLKDKLRILDLSNNPVCVDARYVEETLLSLPQLQLFDGVDVTALGDESYGVNSKQQNSSAASAANRTTSMNQSMQSHHSISQLGHSMQQPPAPYYNNGTPQSSRGSAPSNRASPATAAMLPPPLPCQLPSTVTRHGPSVKQYYQDFVTHVRRTLRSRTYQAVVQKQVQHQQEQQQRRREKELQLQQQQQRAVSATRLRGSSQPPPPITVDQTASEDDWAQHDANGDAYAEPERSMRGSYTAQDAKRYRGFPRASAPAGEEEEPPVPPAPASASRPPLPQFPTSMPPTPNTGRAPPRNVPSSAPPPPPAATTPNGRPYQQHMQQMQQQQQMQSHVPQYMQQTPKGASASAGGYPPRSQPSPGPQSVAMSEMTSVAPRPQSAPTSASKSFDRLFQTGTAASRQRRMSQASSLISHWAAHRGDVAASSDMSFDPQPPQPPNSQQKPGNNSNNNSFAGTSFPFSGDVTSQSGMESATPKKSRVRVRNSIIVMDNGNDDAGAPPPSNSKARNGTFLGEASQYSQAVDGKTPTKRRMCGKRPQEYMYRAQWVEVEDDDALNQTLAASANDLAAEPDARLVRKKGVLHIPAEILQEMQEDEKYSKWHPRYRVQRPIYGFSKPFRDRPEMTPGYAGPSAKERRARSLSPSALVRSQSTDSAWGAGGGAGGAQSANASPTRVDRKKPPSFDNFVQRIRTGFEKLPLRGTFTRASKGLPASFYHMDYEDVEAIRREGYFDETIGDVQRGTYRDPQAAARAADVTGDGVMSVLGTPGRDSDLNSVGGMSFATMSIATGGVGGSVAGSVAVLENTGRSRDETAVVTKLGSVVLSPGKKGRRGSLGSHVSRRTSSGSLAARASTTGSIISVTNQLDSAVGMTPTGPSPKSSGGLTRRSSFASTIMSGEWDGDFSLRDPPNSSSQQQQARDSGYRVQQSDENSYYADIVKYMGKQPAPDQQQQQQQQMGLAVRSSSLENMDPTPPASLRSSLAQPKPSTSPLPQRPSSTTSQSPMPTSESNGNNIANARRASAMAALFSSATSSATNSIDPQDEPARRSQPSASALQSLFPAASAVEDALQPTAQAPTPVPGATPLSSTPPGPAAAAAAAQPTTPGVASSQDSVLTSYLAWLQQQQQQ